MGSAITTDKHPTPIEDWFEIQDKLEEIQFAATPGTHISVWKYYLDSLDQSVNTAPLLLEADGEGLFSHDEVYVATLVRRDGYEGGDKVDGGVAAMLGSLAMNVSKKSLEVCIKSETVEGRSAFEGSCTYFTYAFIGKRAKNCLKMAGLSAAYRLSLLLSNPYRLKVVAGGGVYRSNKLQMGSVSTFVKGRQNADKSLKQYKHIHLVQQLLSENSPIAPRFSLLSYKPRRKMPVLTVSQPQTPKPAINQSKPTHVPSIKPPMLKLALKPYEDATYEQMDDEQKNNKFEMRATARHELKMQKFGNDCSMIVQGLYLSGEKVAKDEQMLRKHNITEIVNCAGDYCLNWFESVQHDTDPKLFRYNYLTFFLKDSQNENIECLFYRVIEFINNSLEKGKNVLVHCIQGISRSVSFVIAYLIFTYGYDYKTAESLVKERRAIACPNNGFMVELIQFHKRLNEDFQSLPLPRVFLVSSHCQETPHIVTARMIKHGLFESEGRKYVGLDQRGIYIVQAEDIVYVWVGAKCDDLVKMKQYWNYAQAFVEKLQKFEKAPIKKRAINQGKQPRQFLDLWGIEAVPQQYQNTDYDRLFNEQKPNPRPGYLRKHYQRQQDHIEEQFISKLFIYPNSDEGLGVFQLDDLEKFCLLVKSDGERIKVFVWKSRDWDDDTERQSLFVDRVIEQHYASYDPEQIEIYEEDGSSVQSLSEEFVSCFS